MQNGQHRGDLGLVLFWECAGGCFFVLGMLWGSGVKMERLDGDSVWRDHRCWHGSVCGNS